MRAEELRMFELLDEIADVCSKKEVRYYLVGNELLYSFLGKRTVSCIGDVCMTLHDYKKIEPELNTFEERVVESVDNNPDISGLYYRYVDRSSLMIQPEYHKIRREHGVAVNIHILRKNDNLSKKLCRYEDIMESGIEGVSHKKNNFSSFFFRKKKNKNGFAKWLNDQLFKSALKDISETSILKIPGAGKFFFDTGYWNNTGTVAVNKKKYSTVSSPKSILCQWYGNDFEQRNYRPCNENFQVISDTSVSYKELADDYWEKYNKSNEFWERRSNFIKFYNYNWVNLNVELRKRQNQLYFQKSRFWLWKRYFFEKERLKSLLVSERYDELQLLFRDMNIHVDMNLQYGQVPFFDRDIWDIYITVLKEQKETERIKLYEETLKKYPVGELSEKELRKYFSDYPKEKITIRQI